MISLDQKHGWTSKQATYSYDTTHQHIMGETVNILFILREDSM